MTWEGGRSHECEISSSSRLEDTFAFVFQSFWFTEWCAFNYRKRTEHKYVTQAMPAMLPCQGKEVAALDVFRHRERICKLSCSRARHRIHRPASRQKRRGHRHRLSSQFTRGCDRQPVASDRHAGWQRERFAAQARLALHGPAAHGRHQPAARCFTLVSAQRDD